MTDFDCMIQVLKNSGFVIVENPRAKFSDGRHPPDPVHDEYHVLSGDDIAWISDGRVKINGIPDRMVVFPATHDEIAYFVFDTDGKALTLQWTT